MISLDNSERVKGWLFGKALPFWAETGADKKFGGFVEQLGFNGSDAAAPYKRVRVTCRQVYSFAHAKLLGWDDATGFIHDGAEFLVAKAWQGDAAGFARRLNRDGSVLDPTPDLYEHAFAILAFSFAYRATGEGGYRDWALKTYDWIDAHLRDHNGEGFWHQRPPEGPRQQNPHMHLTESSLDALQATGDARFRALGTELTTLFHDRLFDHNTKTLTEYFDRQWRPAAGEKGLIVEPGHQFEWAWILSRAMRVLGAGDVGVIHALVETGDRLGLNAATGAVMNRVARNGQPLDAGSRSWTNTERLKALIALAEQGDGATAEQIDAAIDLLFTHFLSSHHGKDIPEGAWIDEIDAAGVPVSETIPASIFYHFMLAFAEVLRVGDAQGEAGPKAP